MIIIYTETYIGLCDTTFKLRYRNHICSFRNEPYKHATELSKHIWSLKDQKIAYQIKWRKIKQARSYSNVSKRCNLCLWEKNFILRRPEMSTLNSRTELASGCRHARQFLLKKCSFLLVMTTNVYCPVFSNLFACNPYSWQSPDDCCA